MTANREYDMLLEKSPSNLKVTCARAVVVALIVGTVLNLINQGDALLRGSEVDLAKLLLTYIVPFAVSVHGAMSARRVKEP